MSQEPEETHVAIPVVEETAVVDKRKRVTGTVRLRTQVHEHEVVVDEPVRVEEISVERVRVDRWVDAPVPVRQEGDTTIVPVFEEVVVVEKRLKMTEEVRISKRQVTRRTPERVMVRRQEAIVDRLAPPAADDAGTAAVPETGTQK